MAGYDDSLHAYLARVGLKDNNAAVARHKQVCEKEDICVSTREPGAEGLPSLSREEV